MEKKGAGWLGIPGFVPSLSSDMDEVGAWCAETEHVVEGERVLSVRSVYDPAHGCWNLDFPVLLVTKGHCVDVTNSGLDQVAIGVDRVDPQAPIARDWEEWTYEWRDYPCEPAIGKAIRSIRPTVEEEEQYMNHGWLNGIEVCFDDGLLLIQNGLDTNLLWWVGADGACARLGSRGS